MATAILTPSVQPQAMAAGTPPATPQTAVGVGGSGNVSLYVGDLDSSVNDAQLYDLFNQVAQVVSVRVCRDQARRTSLGYAYVNFSNPQDAVNARELLNFTPINGKPIRIMFSHRDPSIRKSGHANVFIKNLDPSIDNKALHETFAAFGTVLSCKVAVDGNGQSKGYGFVQFDKEESAMNAIKQLDGMLINDKKVYVGFFVRQQERSRVNGSPKFTNVYVKNLPETTTDDDLNDFFGKYGSITSVVVMRDANGKSKCFGFVNFENPNDAATAVEKLNGVSLNEQVLYVGKAQRKSEREAELRSKFEQERKSKFEKLQGSNLYMKNLDDNIDDEKLKELFSEFGTVTSCKVMVNPQGLSKGSGFVAFSTPEEATRALTEMNGKMIGQKPLFVAVAERKEDRRARLQAQFAQAQSLGAMTPVPIGMHGFHPGAPRLATHQQLYIGQGGTPGGGGLISGGPQPLAAAGYGFQQQLLPGIRPHSFIMPYHQFQRQGGQQPGQRFGSRRGGNTPQMQQQMMYRNSNTGFNRYMSNGRNNMDPSMAPQAMAGPMMQLPLDGSGMPADIQRSGPMPMSTLASALASATPQAQRMMLGEQLFPLVERIERENAGKVTGMLLEMDQTEVLHLIESPDALKKKVGEAMDVLRLASSATDSASDQLGSLSLNK